MRGIVRLAVGAARVAFYGFIAVCGALLIWGAMDGPSRSPSPLASQSMTAPPSRPIATTPAPNLFEMQPSNPAEDHPAAQPMPLLSAPASSQDKPSNAGGATSSKTVSSASKSHTVNELTKCKVIADIFDREPMDKQAIANVMAVVSELYVTFDAAAERAGRTMIYDRMSEDGKTNTMALATSQCAKRPDITLRQSARNAYDGIYATGKAIGAYD